MLFVQRISLNRSDRKFRGLKNSMKRVRRIYRLDLIENFNRFSSQRKYFDA